MAYKIISEDEPLFIESTVWLIFGEPGIGKAQPMSSMVVTPKGFCPIGILKIGDKVIGQDGKPHSIIGIYDQGELPIYSVKFNDCSKTRCSLDHLWKVKTRKDRLNDREGRIVNLATILSDYKMKDGRKKYSIDFCSPVEMYENQLLIDPYLMGVLLGDGCLSRCSITNSERDIIYKIQDRCDSINISESNSNKNEYFVKGIKDQLKQYGLFEKKSHEKFIPIKYLCNSIDNRLELLRGLLDTDGYIGSSIEYSTTSEDLALSVKYLVQSLGGSINIKLRKSPKFSYKNEIREGKDNYRVTISFSNNIIPVSSQKHLYKYEKVKRIQDHFILSITSDGFEECRCIKLDSQDELYLTDDFIVTHNTSLSFTAENPLLEDFDGGLQRAIGRKKALTMESWEDAVQFHHSGEIEKLGIKALIFDTVGTMLDNFISQAVIRDDPKNAKRDGSLALGGYGAMKNVFNAFINEMKTRKIDLIFIAHDDDENIKDAIKKKPKITGGSYDIIKGVADMVGYMETEGDKRVIDFNPCDRHVGKNSAQIPKQVVPQFSDPEYGTFFARLITVCKEKMNEMTKAQEDAVKLVQENQEKIAAANTIEELNPLADAIQEMSNTYRIQLSKPLNEKYGVFFNDLLKEVKYTVQMDAVVEKVKNAPELVKKHLRSSIMTKVRELGFKWDEGLGIYLDKNGKPTDAPEGEEEQTGDQGKQQNSDQVQNANENKDQKKEPVKADEKAKDNQLQMKSPEAKATDKKVETVKNSQENSQAIKEPKIF